MAQALNGAAALREAFQDAFEMTHQADPDGLLFYNDYNETNPVKREKIYSLVSDLLDQYVPVHGIGMQAHWNVIDSVTFWGVADNYTWLDDFPVRGRKNWPFLFDEQMEPKEAFRRVIDLTETEGRSK